LNTADKPATTLAEKRLEVENQTHFQSSAFLVFTGYEDLSAEKKCLLIDIERLLQAQIDGVKSGTYSSRTSLLFFNLMLVTKYLIDAAGACAGLFYRIRNQAPEETLIVSGGRLG
jgi:hypothetical protein